MQLNVCLDALGRHPWVLVTLLHTHVSIRIHARA